MNFEHQVLQLQAYCERTGCYPALENLRICAVAEQQPDLEFLAAEAEELQKLDSILAKDTTLSVPEKYQLRATNAQLLGSVRRAEHGLKLLAG